MEGGGVGSKGNGCEGQVGEIGEESHVDIPDLGQIMDNGLNSGVGHKVAVGDIDFHELWAVLSECKDGPICQENALAELDLS